MTESASDTPPRSHSELTDGLTELETVMLQLEALLIERKQDTREDLSGTDRTLEDVYDGECSNCGQLWEADKMMPIPDRDLCIPCWRDANDLPKLPHPRNIDA